jgi:outer membrane protein OmpA-like peptidoglycan-associated protein
MKKIFSLFIVIMAFIFLSSCAQEQVKKPDKVGADTTVIGASNDQLSKYPVAGFAYKSSKVPAQEWDKWAKVAAPVIKGIVDKIPDGYVMEVRGHTDARGPAEAEGNKPGNSKISTDRAKAVYNSLAKAGIKSDKITYRGVGSTEPKPGVDANSAEQRRVTFVIVPKS